jgi:hypothetical protein
MKSARSVLMRVALLFGLLAGAAAATDLANPLQLYDGSWRVVRKDLPSGAKPDELKNQCSQMGKYFACQQMVNGEVSALLIFISTDKPGRYVTQSINPQGRPLGKGNLEISGNRWVFTSSWDQGGRMTYYQTINIFTGHDRIHFEQQESNDGKVWTTKNSGDETRISVGR